MAQYTYTPIPPNTIRVLHLHPGPPDSPLRGRLAPYPLPQATTATAANDLPASNYDCVSYVWGGDEKLHTIFLSDNGPLPITATLHSLLRRLRKQFSDSGDNDPRPLPVWADAICINQDDAIEKGLQVGLMPAIYRGARRVVVDLGEESEDLDDAYVLPVFDWCTLPWLRARYWCLCVYRIVLTYGAKVVVNEHMVEKAHLVRGRTRSAGDRQADHPTGGGDAVGVRGSRC